MKRALGLAVSLSGIAILAPAAPAQAAVPDECRVTAGTPRLAADGMIKATGTRTGCQEPATLRVRIWKVLTGPDRAVKSVVSPPGAGRLTASVRCANGVFYTTVTDSIGRVARSKAVRLSCTTVGTAIENEVVRLTNLERAKAGCKPLVHDRRLRQAAYAHSADMSARNYFSHTSLDGRTFVDRIEATGYRYTALAENIAKGHPTAQAVVRGWMDSPGHRSNILDCRFTHIGVGYVKAGGPYWTQTFGRP